METNYIDAHCHLQFDAYSADRDAIAEQMQERGIAGIVVGCDFETSRLAIELADEYEHLSAAIGLHPNNDGGEQFAAATYRRLASSGKVVALGECGLDYFRPADATPEVKEKQKALFIEQIALAAELDKPLIIHARPTKGTQDAYIDVIALLQEAKEKYPSLRGDAHFFAGGVEEMRAFNALDFTVSFTAVITFARDYDAVIRAVPLDMILAETDSPYVAPASRRGQRNDPLAVVEVAAKIAEIRGEDPELVRAALVANTTRLFRLG